MIASKSMSEIILGEKISFESWGGVRKLFRGLNAKIIKIKIKEKYHEFFYCSEKFFENVK